METDRLRYFCAIVDAGSMTKASEVLGVSHSGLSKAVSVLQDELGIQVFRPRGRGLELTDKGREIYNKSREVLRLIGQLGSNVPTAPKSLRIGLPEVLALTIAGSVVAKFGAGVTVDEMDSGEIESKILEGKLDFGLTFVPFPHKNLDHFKLAKIEFASYGLRGAFDKMHVDEIPYVIPSAEMRENPLSIKIRDGWDSKRFRETPYRANSLAIALQMVRSGRCAVFAPSFVIKEFNRVANESSWLVEVDEKRKTAERAIFLVKRSSEDESNEMKWIAKTIRNLRKIRPSRPN